MYLDGTSFEDYLRLPLPENHINHRFHIKIFLDRFGECDLKNLCHDYYSLTVFNSMHLSMFLLKLILLFVNSTNLFLLNSILQLGTSEKIKGGNAEDWNGRRGSGSEVKSCTSPTWGKLWTIIPQVCEQVERYIIVVY